MNKSNQTTIYIIFAVVVLLVGVGAFYSGTVYQKGQTTSGVSTNGAGLGGMANGGGGFGARMGSGGIGAVTAVSDTSITVSVRSRGETTTTPKTYVINSSTNITNNGSTVAASTIVVGDNVLIQTSTSDTATATSITVNPSFGGSAGQAPTGATQSTTDNSSDSIPQNSV